MNVQMTAVNLNTHMQSAVLKLLKLVLKLVENVQLNAAQQTTKIKKFVHKVALKYFNVLGLLSLR